MNEDAIDVLREQIGRNLRYCFTFRGEPWRWQVTNSGWHTALAAAGIRDFRFHDLRHTWASWHRQAGTSCADLNALMARIRSRYAETQHLKLAT